MSPYALYRPPLAAGEHHTVPPGKRGESTYRPLPSYTKLSVTAVSTFSNSSALHFCVSSRFNTWTTRAVTAPCTVLVYRYWTLAVSKTATRNARATSLIYDHTKNDTNKYKNQLNKLWNEVGMEVLKSTQTR